MSIKQQRLSHFSSSFNPLLLASVLSTDSNIHRSVISSILNHRALPNLLPMSRSLITPPPEERLCGAIGKNLLPALGCSESTTLTSPMSPRFASYKIRSQRHKWRVLKKKARKALNKACSVLSSPGDSFVSSKLRQLPRDPASIIQATTNIYCRVLERAGEILDAPLVNKQFALALVEIAEKHALETFEGKFEVLKDMPGFKALQQVYVDPQTLMDLYAMMLLLEQFTRVWTATKETEPHLLKLPKDEPHLKQSENACESTESGEKAKDAKDVVEKPEKNESRRSPFHRLGGRISGFLECISYSGDSEIDSPLVSEIKLPEPTPPSPDPEIVEACDFIDFDVDENAVLAGDTKPYQVYVGLVHNVKIDCTSRYGGQRVHTAAMATLKNCFKPQVCTRRLQFDDEHLAESGRELNLPLAPSTPVRLILKVDHFKEDRGDKSASIMESDSVAQTMAEIRLLRDKCLSWKLFFGFDQNISADLTTVMDKVMAGGFFCDETLLTHKQALDSQKLLRQGAALVCGAADHYSAFYSSPRKRISQVGEMHTTLDHVRGILAEARKAGTAQMAHMSDVVSRIELDCALATEAKTHLKHIYVACCRGTEAAPVLDSTMKRYMARSKYVDHCKATNWAVTMEDSWKLVRRLHYLVDEAVQEMDARVERLEIELHRLGT